MACLAMAHLLSMGDFAEIAAGAGYIDDISAIVDETRERVERNQELWAFAEVLRVKGQILLSRNKPDPDEAEEYFVRSLARSRLRAARIVLGTARGDEPRPIEARSGSYRGGARSPGIRV